MPHRKDTAELETIDMPVPSEIVLPMQQHIGALCEPVVKKGDHVDVGSLVGHAPRGLSADIFSGVSGTVKAIQPVFYSTGKTDTTVIIESDGAQTVADTVAPPEVTDQASFLAAIKKSGLVGLGGAGFPTDIKLAPPNLEEIDLYVVNATECEPYLSTDYREMMESPDDVLFGIRETCRHLGIPNAMICIESNKPKAIELMRELTKDDSSIQVKALPSRYPQSRERARAQCHGTRRPARKAPDRRGRHVEQRDHHGLHRTLPENRDAPRQKTLHRFRRRHRSPLQREHHHRHAPARRHGIRRADEGAAQGGAGRTHDGQRQIDMDYPVIRQNNGVLVFSKDAMEQPATTACIRCGRCTNSCPMQLSPIAIKKAYTVQDAKKLDDLMADLCMGCGTCSFVCPAKQPLAQTSKLARDFMRAEMARRG